MDERSLRIQQWFEWPLIVAALLVIPSIVLEETGFGGEAGTVIGSVLNWTIWLAFLTEAVVMLVVVPKKTLWLRKHPLDVAIVVLTPPIVPAGLQALRVFRLLRVLRLVRLFTLRRVLSLEGVRDAGVMAAIVVLTGGVAFAAVEGISAWSGVWFALNMVTTVGNPGYSAETVAGRVIAVVVMLVGIGFVALVTAFVAERFIRTGSATEAQDQMISKLDAIEKRLDRIENGGGSRSPMMPRDQG